MKYKISIDKKIDPERVIDLWLSVSWGKSDDYNKNDTEDALKNTSALIKAENSKGELIGIARILSDNKYHTVLAEIIVHPNFQKKGIGTAIIKKLMDEYSHTTIYLDALPDNEQFFAKQGFVKRKKMIVYSLEPKK